MEITTKVLPTHVELAVTGRLDAYWADHLAAAIDEVLRRGADRIRLDLAAVEYLSSVGIRVLLRYYKEAQRLEGSFAVVRPSAAVQTVLELAGLDAILATGEVAPQETAAETSRTLEIGGAIFDVHPLARDATLTARLIGDPAATHGADCRAVRITGSTLAVGLGAFGRDLDDCRARFGEVLAVAGAAIHLPTDGTSAPDTQVAAGAFVPELRVLHALVCEGPPALMARFEPAGGSGAVPLSTLVEAALSLAAAEAVAVVVLAEAAGLVGAALRRSPASAPMSLELPAVRDWLSFTPERAFARSLALVAGVAARRPSAPLAAFLRPLGPEPAPSGHLHAAAFGFQPLRKGRIDLGQSVAAVFESAVPQGVLHLLDDDRPIVGSGQSEFVRGALWVGPIGAIESAP